MAKPVVKKEEGAKFVERKWTRDVVTFGVLFGLLGAVNFLPPDTSLAEVQQKGRIAACMPTDYAPLVTKNPEMPGFDVELMQAVADKLGVRFSVVSNSAMARDFNPRSWRVTRAQCQVLAGGVILSGPVLSFLDSSPAYLTTGWAVIGREGFESLEGKTVGFYAGINGLDRIALSSYFRRNGVTTKLVSSAEALASGLRNGDFDLAVSESLIARTISGENEWIVKLMPAELENYPIGIGMWKGDLTLKREITKAIESLTAEGFIDSLKAKYEIDDLEGMLGAEEARPL